MATRVQSKTANSAGGTVSTLDVVFDATPTAGNLIAVAAATNGTSSTLSAVSAATGTNISFIEIPVTQGASGTTLLLAIGRVFASASATITVTTSSAGGIAIAAAEYTGIANIWDKLVGATGSSTSAASGATATTATANQLWIGAIGHRASGGATFSSPTNSFTIVGQDKSSIASTADRSVALLERIVSGTGTANAGATISTTGVWVAQVVTFEEPTAGGSGASYTFG